MMNSGGYLQWPDYLLITLVLLVSAAVGVYYACTGGRQRTTKEYLLADGNMHWLPVGTSLVASYISTLTILGVPAEIYVFGSGFSYIIPTAFVGGLFAHKIYLPVFRNLGITSIYEYTAMRFGQKVALISMGTGVIQMLLRTTLVIYGPSLALSQVTGINLWISVILVTGISVCYTFLGGLKAVLWADLLQSGFMVAGFLAVFIVGVVRAGGLSTVWNVNKLSGRLEFLEASKMFDMDPRARHTVWSVGSGGFIMLAGLLATSQSSVQRVLSLRSNHDSFLSYTFASFGMAAFLLVGTLIGLVIYAYYKHCDPISAGLVNNKDQLYPLFVMDLFGKYPGVPGFMLASIFSASLSTVSTTLNAMSAVLLRNVVLPCKPSLTDEKATLVSKIICLVLGGISIGLVGLARSLGGGILYMANALVGMTAGPNLAVFTLGVLNPLANEVGMLVGFFTSITFISWIGMGGLIKKPYVYKYPVTTTGCNITDPMELANLTLPTYDSSTWNPESHYRSGVEAVYDISYMWNGFLSFLLTSIIACLISVIFEKRNQPKVHSKLITPVIHNLVHRLPKRIENAIDYSDLQSTYTNNQMECERSLEMESKDL